MFSEASKLAMLRNLDLEFWSAPWLGKKHSKYENSQVFAKISSSPARDPEIKRTEKRTASHPFVKGMMLSVSANSVP